MKNNLKIKIIAPSSKCEGIEDIITDLKGKLAEESVELIFSKDMISNCELPFFAASQDIRQNDLQKAITSGEYQVIWAARGGYGAANLIEEALSYKLKNSPILIGFSDITALHLLFNQHYKLPSIHGPVATSYVRNNDNFDIFKKILKGEKQSYNLIPISSKNSNPIAGEVSGGNLTVLTTMIGTKLSPHFKDKIVLLEDANEKGYQIHRHLMHMKQAGCFDEARAILFGDFTNSDNIAEIAIKSFCENEINIPSFCINSIGHAVANKPIVMESEAIIKDNILIVESPFSISI